jgi:hypothetical protein
VAGSRIYRLEVLANIVSEVCNSVLGIADKLGLGLSAVVFFTINVGQNSRDLTISFLVGDDFSLAFLYIKPLEYSSRFTIGC